MCLSPGHGQSYSARRDPQPLGSVSEAAGSCPRSRLASPLCPGNLKGKRKPEKPGPGTGQPGLPGPGCGGILCSRALPGQVRYLPCYLSSKWHNREALTGNVELFIVMVIVSPDLCTFFWSFGKAPQMRSTFRPTFGWAAATKTGGRVRTSGRVTKWGF